MFPRYLPGAAKDIALRRDKKCKAAFIIMKKERFMNEKDLFENWKKEEETAFIKGWDFSHIEGRYAEETDFGWDYRETVLKYLKDDMKLLDVDTGGGEVLLSLGHPFENTAASEGYPPNVKLCNETLLPLGIDFRRGNAEKILPFEDESFDIIINRHGSFNPRDVYRMLKPGGMFITQQVGAENERELVELLTDSKELPFPQQYLKIAKENFVRAGFSVVEEGESYNSIKFFDTGALVWFARIIQWEFPGFSVENNFSNIMKAHRIIEKNGFVEGHTHRFMLVVQKK